MFRLASAAAGEVEHVRAEELSVDLATDAKGFDVIDRTNLKTLLQEHKLASTGIIDPQTARKLGEIAGAQALVTGTIVPFGETVHISIKVLDTATARIISGSVADMPRSKEINELLAKGIATGNQAVMPSPVRTEAVESKKSMEYGTGQIGDFLLSIKNCYESGERTKSG